LLVLLAYANSFRAGFVFDNRVLLLEDTRLRALTTSNLNLILQKPYWWPFVDVPLYRPVTTFSYLLNYSVFGNANRPPGYHVVNWLLHTANVWLVFGLALKIGRRFWLAVFVAALWAVHPLGTEAVTNIVGRADLLAAFGVLLSFYSHLAAKDSHASRRWSWTAASLAAMTVAVFSKESAIAGVGVIVLYDLLSERSSPFATTVRHWIILALPAVLFLYQRSAVLAGTATEFPYVDNPIAGAPFWTGRLTALSVMGRYLALLVWPVRLSADYSFSQIPLASGSSSDWLAWISIVALAVVAAVALKANRVVGFCLAAALITFLPAANLLFPTGTIMAERLMYLPSACLIAVLVAGVYWAATRLRVPATAPAVLAIALLLCSARTVVRNSDWFDELSLWSGTAQAAPRSFKSHGSLAEALYRADPTHSNLDQVIAEKEKSLKILQGVPDPAAISKPYREAAVYYLEYGDWLEEHHRDPAAVSNAYRRAATLGEQYLRLTAERPVSAKDTSDARLLVSTAYAHLQEGDKAVAAARQAASDQPFNRLSYRALAAALLNTRHQNEAAVELMTGFMVTGNQELRSALVDLYRSGLDTEGCATITSGSSVILNFSCEIVRRHLCDAAARAIEIQRRNGHAELAAQVAILTSDAKCEALTPVGTP
jgi:protein O-mannosyl-transferase